MSTSVRNRIRGLEIVTHLCEHFSYNLYEHRFVARATWYTTRGTRRNHLSTRKNFHSNNKFFCMACTFQNEANKALFTANACIRKTRRAIKRCYLLLISSSVKLLIFSFHLLWIAHIKSHHILKLHARDKKRYFNQHAQ